MIFVWDFVTKSESLQTKMFIYSLGGHILEIANLSCIENVLQFDQW